MKAQNYTSFFESINKYTPLKEYAKYFDLNAKFKDPFHEVEGLQNIFRIFLNMYKKLEEPKFKIDEIVENRNIAYIKWTFTFRFKKDKEIQSFEGVSRVVFNEENKVVLHEDFWDAASNLYEKLPFVSLLIRFVKRKIND
ncbi:nuclear transport factor 2 family protein [Halarcobacter bivalviorum]|uniref:Isomerase n=1 Tax=Halarcobacter bivalviorum TaxID=663364 RepID=A0AAX2ACZ3_9BACT|nr:nuclear transport factor 2 family protein [Halarcobacter bivalviorum]AXH12125.1 nuclear transport factor 2 family protein [Halarcobacter bivalviorum]RXK11234.1 isomerase [Halarcobacter bivalviorum]